MTFTPSGARSRLEDGALLAARLCMASLFLWSGVEKMTDLAGAAGFAASHGVPFARALMPLAAIFELATGFMLVAGWRTRVAAAALCAWMLILGPWFHQFWRVPPGLFWQLMVDDFFHHFVMIGGMIYVVVFGPGAYSLDARRHVRKV